MLLIFLEEWGRKFPRQDEWANTNKSFILGGQEQEGSGLSSAGAGFVIGDFSACGR